MMIKSPPLFDEFRGNACPRSGSDDGLAFPQGLMEALDDLLPGVGVSLTCPWVRHKATMVWRKKVSCRRVHVKTS